MSDDPDRLEASGGHRSGESKGAESRRHAGSLAEPAPPDGSLPEARLPEARLGDAGLFGASLAFESPLRLRRRVGPRVRQVRSLARPYKIEVKRFSKFLVVGTLGFAVDFSVFNLLSHGLGVHPILGQVISLVCAIVSNFLFNHFWIYHDAHDRSILKQFVQFFMVSVSVALLRVPLFTLTHQPFGELAARLLGLAPTTAEIVGNNAALILTVAIGLFWNFLVNRFWTCRHAPRG